MKWRGEHKWPVFKALLDPMLKYFCMAVVALILVSGSSYWLAGYSWAFCRHDLGRILLFAFLGVFPSVMVAVLVEAVSTKGILFAKTLSFFLTAAPILGISALTQTTGSGITLRTIITFLLLYAAINVYSYFNATTLHLEEKKLADQINQHLDEFHKDENATHPS